MEAHKAKTILNAIKRQAVQREVYEALELAIEVLAWKALEEKQEETELIEEK